MHFDDYRISEDIKDQIHQRSDAWGAALLATGVPIYYISSRKKIS